MAHIFGTGMGGRESSDDRGNVAFLCKRHHDILDGRVHDLEGASLLNLYAGGPFRGERRSEMASALADIVAAKRSYEADD